MNKWSPKNIERRRVSSEIDMLTELGRRPPTLEEFEALQAVNRDEEEASVRRCPCGELATHPVPKLVRERNDGKQAIYAAPPRYRRAVPHGSTILNTLLYFLTLGNIRIREEPLSDVCEAHAHVADADMDNFIYNEIRAEQARTNIAIAQKAAAFETENMLKRISDSLTEEQKRKVRQLSAKRNDIRAVSNGTGPTSEQRAQQN
jgi:hypothetical protein